MQLDPRIQQGAALLAGLCVLFAATVGVTKFLHRHGGPAPLTPEQVVAQEVAANPALVSRDACIRLAILPLPPALREPDPLPSEAEVRAHNDNDLRGWLKASNPAIMALPMNHEQLVQAVMATMPEVKRFRDAAKERIPVQMRQIAVYKGICAKNWPAKDRLAAALFSLHRGALRAASHVIR
ncbi:hypothetical protein KDX23_07770 [Burkholderia vietnamiensis]|uniref:hypothetical protein n=1 Tax=Burkholderia vietnamiensis TaxID=60552 RepID=UPI001B8F6BF0|nr:hypothetical protein [Burkholderia vietnamiensis]MBR8082643.1 hypothetical protein [Burkholderia vietnamiensis]